MFRKTLTAAVTALGIAGVSMTVATPASATLYFHPYKHQKVVVVKHKVCFIVYKHGYPVYVCRWV